ncbi:acetyltransferase [Commensalibacter papalotli (ex Servin-Garciduenas et al. 2014)]|uniref:Acetyltransferase n=1 Tax=Commensalibacter papalotli (ex Servin-Garciduenas et al. 2014) TaxID=1208583 RepID=W7E8E4_9PROT|nr:acetyltransferase [Commensalibacter papalotli (ex Servin-Garciduenas et al. 2014)]
MNINEFIAYCQEGHSISPEQPELLNLLHQCHCNTQRFTMTLNNNFHTQDEIVDLFSQLTGKLVDPYFVCSPPPFFIQILVKTFILERMYFLYRLFIPRLWRYFYYCANIASTR